MKGFVYCVFLACFTMLSGCANWALEEKCENTNWFDHSQQVAFNGRYLDEDGLVKDCRKVDRINGVQIDQGFKLGREKMCQYDEIFSRAKEGTPVFFKFCDGLDMSRMKEQYGRGLLFYCTNEKAYSFGKAGKVYKNLCNHEQEKKFLPGYYKGRKEYLIDTISVNENLMTSLDERETSISASEGRLSMEYQRLPNASECESKKVYNEASKVDEQKTICEEATYVKNMRSQLSGELSHLRSQLQRIRNDWRESALLVKTLRADLLQIPQQ